MENYSWVEDYCRQKRGAHIEYKESWRAFRYMVGGKIFVLRFLDNNGRPIINVKTQPELGQFFRLQFPEKITPGYHMNKEHWNSIYEDTVVPEEVVKELLDHSYDLVFSSLPEKRQKQILLYG